MRDVAGMDVRGEKVEADVSQVESRYAIMLSSSQSA